MAHSDQETEIKVAIADVRAVRRLLRQAGFVVHTPRLFEQNTVYDTPKLTLRRQARLLRLRIAGKSATLTFKNRPTPSRHKSREELELKLAMSDAGKLARIVEGIGFRPSFRYEKYRTEYERPSQRGTVTLDETPIGLYLELEGTSPWIDRTARRLGFDESAYITKSYGALYLEWCRRHHLKPADMVFRSTSEART